MGSALLLSASPQTVADPELTGVEEESVEVVKPGCMVDVNGTVVGHPGNPDPVGKLSKLTSLTGSQCCRNQRFAHAPEPTAIKNMHF